MSILRKWSGHPLQFSWNFYSNCHYPIWWTSANFEWNLSRNGMIIKLFSWGHLARGEQIVHIWPCLKPYYCQTTLVNNPNISGMLVTLPNIRKMSWSTLWRSNVKGHGPPKLTFLALATNFGKFSNLATVYFLIVFAHMWKKCCWYNNVWL